jgi:hypothetical protein
VSDFSIQDLQDSDQETCWVRDPNRMLHARATDLVLDLWANFEEAWRGDLAEAVAIVLQLEEVLIPGRFSIRARVGDASVGLETELEKA